MGGLQQYKVAPAHRVEVVSEVQVGGGAAHLSPLLTGESYPEHLKHLQLLQLSVCALIFRWLSLEALWGFSWDFPSLASLMQWSKSPAVPSMFL